MKSYRYFKSLNCYFTIDEAKNSFKEDSDKFQKYVEQLTYEAERAKIETESLIELKQKKNKKINSIREELAEVNKLLHIKIIANLFLEK